MSASLEARLQNAVERLVPDVSLRWRELEGCAGLRGYFLDEEAAQRPLPPDKVEAVMHDPPFWSLLWPSGQALCRLISEHPELVRGKSVLDFGAGCGLVACAAARAGALVRAVDCDPLAALACALNADGNGVSLHIEERYLSQPVDVLLLADFLYDSTNLGLFETLQARAVEVVVVDSRLKTLDYPKYTFLGQADGWAVPDLDPHREFGRLSFWYRGPERAKWEYVLASSAPVAHKGSQC